MKIVLNEDGSIFKLLREERVGRGQNLSRTIQVEWEEKQSPIAMIYTLKRDDIPLLSQ